MELLISYIDSRKCISITVATPCQHIRRLVPINKALQIKQSLTDALNEAEGLSEIQKQLINK